MLLLKLFSDLYFCNFYVFTEVSNEKKYIHQILKDIRKQKKITNLTEQDPTIFQMIASQL